MTIVSNATQYSLWNCIGLTLLAILHYIFKYFTIPKNAIKYDRFVVS